MDRIEIRLSTFAGFASVPLRARDRKAIEIWEMLLTTYDPATDYWKRPREAIRHHAVNGGLGGLAGMEFQSSDPSRVRNHEVAIREFLTWWEAFRPTSAGSAKAVTLPAGPLDVVVNPDLIVRAGSQSYVVRIRFNKGTPLLHPERVVTTSLMSEGFPGSVPAILDLATREFTIRAGSDREILEKTAADLASRFPRDR